MLNPQPFERIIVATCTLFLDSWHPFDGQSSNFGLEGISGSINIATGPSGNAPHGIISIRSRDAVLHQPGRIAVLVGTGGGIFVRSGFSLFQSIGDVMKTIVGLLKLLVTSSISGLSIFDNICSLVVEVQIKMYLRYGVISMKTLLVWVSIFSVEFLSLDQGQSCILFVENVIDLRPATKYFTITFSLVFYLLTQKWGAYL